MFELINYELKNNNKNEKENFEVACVRFIIM